MWDVGWAVEDPVDAVANISSNNAAVLGLGVFLDDITKLAEEGTRLDKLDGFFQALASSFGNTDGIRICLCLVANIIGFVEISVEALVVQSYIEVYNVAI